MKMRRVLDPRKCNVCAVSHPLSGKDRVNGLESNSKFRGEGASFRVNALH